MANVTTIIYTTGSPGAGKTYTRGCRFVIDYLIQNAPVKIKNDEYDGGRHISNFPIDKEKVCNYVYKNLKKKYKKKLARENIREESLEEIKERLQLIPDDVIEDWKKGNSTPADFFGDADLFNAHIAIDEIHEILPADCSKELRKEWEDWLSKIRHYGATIEFLTQSPEKVNALIRNICNVRLEIVNSETFRDPIFKIPKLYWYNLFAKFTGFYSTKIFINEYLTSSSKLKNQINHTYNYLLEPFYFNFYKSYTKSDKSILKEYQKKNFLSLIIWFLNDNAYQVLITLSKIALFVFFIYLLFSGMLMKAFTAPLEEAMNNNTESAQVDKKEIDKNKSNKNNNGGKDEINKSKNDATISDNSDYSDSQRRDKISKKIKEKKKKQKKVIKYSLITNDYVVTRRGIELKENDKFKGKTIESINYKNRSIKLSNGDIITLYK